MSAPDTAPMELEQSKAGPSNKTARSVEEPPAVFDPSKKLYRLQSKNDDWPLVDLTGITSKAVTRKTATDGENANDKVIYVYSADTSLEYVVKLLDEVSITAVVETTGKPTTIMYPGTDDLYTNALNVHHELGAEGPTMAQGVTRLVHHGYVQLKDELEDGDDEWSKIRPFLIYEAPWNSADLRVVLEAVRSIWEEGVPKVVQYVLRAVFADLARSLDALHAAHVYHHDIKPANLVVGTNRGWNKTAFLEAWELEVRAKIESGSSAANPVLLLLQLQRQAELPDAVGIRIVQNRVIPYLKAAVIDYGVATSVDMLPHTLDVGMYGTEIYADPWLIRSRAHVEKYALGEGYPRVRASAALMGYDYWSFGTTLFYAANMVHPWEEIKDATKMTELIGDPGLAVELTRAVTGLEAAGLGVERTFGLTPEWDTAFGKLTLPQPANPSLEASFLRMGNRVGFKLEQNMDDEWMNAAHLLSFSVVDRFREGTLSQLADKLFVST